MEAPEPIFLSHVRLGQQGKDQTKEQMKGDDMMTVLRVMREESLNSVRMLVKLFELKTMNEGRKARIFLFDNQHLDILVQPRLRSADLLDLVSSHLNLKEKEYFGLTYTDENGNQHWLDLKRRVLDHYYLSQKSIQLLDLHLAIRYYAEGIGCLKDNTTVEVFYQQAHQYIHQGRIECDPQTVFELGGYLMQAAYGDFIDFVTARLQLKEVNVIPTRTLQEHPCLSYCEDQVMASYRKCSGQSRGSCIVNYMAIVEDLPTYGIHYYSVKDKLTVPWFIGISYKGISLYDHNDKKVPRRVFAWKQLENIYYRDRKFSIEVYDPKRGSLKGRGSLTRGPFGQSGINVHSWFTPSSQITKSIWTMAISQHQFYLERLNSKKTGERSMQDIAVDLAHSSASLCGSSVNGTLSRCESTKSLPSSAASSVFDLSPLAETEASISLRSELMAALKERKEHLTNRMEEKILQLKEICSRESKLSGEEVDCSGLIEENKDSSKNIRRLSLLQTRNLLHSAEVTEHSCDQLEADLRLQASVVSCYYRLSKVSPSSAIFRKAWHQRYCKAFHKLLRIEKSLNEKLSSIDKPPCQISVYLNFEALEPGVSSSLHMRRRSESTDRHSYGVFAHASSRDIPTSAPNTPLDRDTGFSLPSFPQRTYNHSKSQSLPYYSRKSCSLSRFSRIGSYKKAVCTEDDVISPLFSDITLSRSNLSNSEQGNLYNVKTSLTTACDSYTELQSPSSTTSPPFWNGIYESTKEDRATSKTGSLDGYYSRKSRGSGAESYSGDINGLVSPIRGPCRGLGSSSEKLKRRDCSSLLQPPNRSNRASLGSPGYRRKNCLASGESTRLFEFDSVDEYLASGTTPGADIPIDSWKPFQLSDMGKSGLRFRRKHPQNETLLEERSRCNSRDNTSRTKSSSNNSRHCDDIARLQQNENDRSSSMLHNGDCSNRSSNQHKRSKSMGITIRRKFISGFDNFERLSVHRETSRKQSDNSPSFAAKNKSLK